MHHIRRSLDRGREYNEYYNRSTAASHRLHTFRRDIVQRKTRHPGIAHWHTTNTDHSMGHRSLDSQKSKAHRLVYPQQCSTLMDMMQHNLLWMGLGRIPDCTMCRCSGWYKLHSLRCKMDTVESLHPHSIQRDNSHSTQCQAEIVQLCSPGIDRSQDRCIPCKQHHKLSKEDCSGHQNSHRRIQDIRSSTLYLHASSDHCHSWCSYRWKQQCKTCMLYRTESTRC